MRALDLGEGEQASAAIHGGGSPPSPCRCFFRRQTFYSFGGNWQFRCPMAVRVLLPPPHGSDQPCPGASSCIPELVSWSDRFAPHPSAKNLASPHLSLSPAMPLRIWNLVPGHKLETGWSVLNYEIAQQKARTLGNLGSQV